MAVAGVLPEASWGAAGRGAGLRCGCGDGEGPNTRLTPQLRPSQPHNGARARAGLRYKCPGAGRGAARRVTSSRSTSSPAPRSAPVGLGAAAARAGLAASRSRLRDVLPAPCIHLGKQPRPGPLVPIKKLFLDPGTRRTISISHWLSGMSV